MSGPPRLLIVADRGMGLSTARIRGEVLIEPLRRAGWVVDLIDVDLRRRSLIRRLARWRTWRAQWRSRAGRIARLARGYDVVYLLKVSSLRVQRAITRTGAKVVFDFADALWRPPHAHLWPDLDRQLAEADAVFTENGFMVRYAQRFNQRVVDLPACTQPERFDARRAAVARDPSTVVVGWVGSPGTAAAIARIAAPLDRLAARHPQLRLRVLGASIERLPRFSSLRVTARERYDEDAMIDELLAMDIGVFPPPDDLEDYEARGTLKGVLYMSAGIPAVFQDHGDCRRFVVDGDNGVLAGDEADWERKLEALIASSELRERIGARGLSTVRERHSLESVARRTEAALREVVGR